jgi:hypothetical protein
VIREQVFMKKWGIVQPSGIISLVREQLVKERAEFLGRLEMNR